VEIGLVIASVVMAVAWALLTRRPRSLPPQPGEPDLAGELPGVKFWQLESV
jgi:hypothetical protein